MSNEKAQTQDINVSPPALEPYELQRLADWYEVDLSDPNPLMAAGAARNCLRAADGFGQRLILMLLEEGFLEANQNPLEALSELIHQWRLLGGKSDMEKAADLVASVRR